MKISKCFKNTSMEFSHIYSWNLILSLFFIYNPTELKLPKKASLLQKHWCLLCLVMNCHSASEWGSSSKWPRSTGLLCLNYQAHLQARISWVKLCILQTLLPALSKPVLASQPQITWRVCNCSCWDQWWNLLKLCCFWVCNGMWDRGALQNGYSNVAAHDTHWRPLER